MSFVPQMLQRTWTPWYDTCLIQCPYSCLAASLSSCFAKWPADDPIEWHLLWAQFALSEVLLEMYPTARKPQSLGQVVKLPYKLCEKWGLGRPGYYSTQM
jgi:hypothetical protein